MRVKKYERAMLKDGDVVSDFCSTIGVTSARRNVQANVAMSLAALKLILLLNRSNPCTLGDMAVFQARTKTLVKIEELFKDYARIDKRYFLPSADFSEVPYLARDFGISFDGPSGDAGDCNDFLSFEAMDWRPLDDCLRGAGIPIAGQSLEWKVSRLFYMYLAMRSACDAQEERVERGAGPGEKMNEH